MAYSPRRKTVGTIQLLPSVERYNELILILHLSPEAIIIDTHHLLSCWLPVGTPPEYPSPTHAIRHDTPMPGTGPADRQSNHRIRVVEQKFD
jgi:hypothetical protein